MYQVTILDFNFLGKTVNTSISQKKNQSLSQPEKILQPYGFIGQLCLDQAAVGIGLRTIEHKVEQIRACRYTHTCTSQNLFFVGKPSCI